MNLKFVLASLISISVLAVGGTYAATTHENDALSVSGAQVSLAQAVDAAVRHTGGVASRAEYERHKGQHVFDVEIVKGKTVLDVKVDAVNGRVVATTEDKFDRGDEQDQED